MILGEVLGGAFVCVAVDDVVDDGAVVRGSGAIGPEQVPFLRRQIKGFRSGTAGFTNFCAAEEVVGGYTKVISQLR